MQDHGESDTATPATSSAATNAVTPAVDPEEHPEGRAIRRPVEYYFSDENLSHDAFMLALTGGAQNLPVSINRVCAFKKMRQYKPPAQVKASIRKSTFLEMVGEKRMRRRVPLAVPPTVEPEVLPDQQKKQPPADKPWLTKGMLRPTGFEDNYADAPVTPAEHAVESELYDPCISFATRIETGIQRYRARRKFHTDTACIFSEFLTLGGIESTPKRFSGGLSKTDIEGMDAGEIAAMTAFHVVPDRVLDAEKWEVDFAAIAQAFLTPERVYNFFSSGSSEAVRTVVNVLDNFYRWLQHHDVCVEYNDQLSQAHVVCDIALRELPKAVKVLTLMPDPSSTACSALFGGNTLAVSSAEQSWDGADSGGWSTEHAKGLVMAGISALGTDEQWAMARDAVGYEITRSDELGLQVVAIDLPNEDTKSFYDQQRLQNTYLRPLGRLHCREMNNTLSQAHRVVPEGQDEQPIVIWVEEETLEHCFVGMKLEACVCESNIGVKWFDTIKSVNASYFEVIANEYYDKEQDAVLPKYFYKRLRMIALRGWQSQEELKGVAQGGAEMNTVEGEANEDEGEVTRFVENATW